MTDELLEEYFPRDIAQLVVLCAVDSYLEVTKRTETFILKSFPKMKHGADYKCENTIAGSILMESNYKYGHRHGISRLKVGDGPFLNVGYGEHGVFTPSPHHVEHDEYDEEAQCVI